jgi:hypothetical protein
MQQRLDLPPARGVLWEAVQQHDRLAIDRSAITHPKAQPVAFETIHEAHVNGIHPRPPPDLGGGRCVRCAEWVSR